MTDLFEMTDQPQIDETKNYLQDLVGEGKKFKSPEDLAKGKYESDQYIEILKKRLDEMRNDYVRVTEENKAKAKLEDLINQMNLKHQTPESDLPPADQVNKPGYDPKEIESLVYNKLQEHENAKKQQENFNLVRSKLKEQYGPNFQTVLKEQVESMGLSDNFVNELARNHPSVLLRTLGVGASSPAESFQAPPRGSFRTDQFAPKGAPKRTWAYYQEMYKKDPKLYHDPKIAVQMQRDAIELGDAFKDGDYHL